MSYGLKIFNWVEDAEKEFGGVRSFYEAKEVDDYIRSLKAENKRLQKQYLQAVKSANKNIAKNVDGNAKYWQDLCEKRTKMYLEELKAAAELTGRELAKWKALARNFGCFNQSELYMMVESMKNQVDFLCKSRKPADPQYVDEWFRFKKMF